MEQEIGALALALAGGIASKDTLNRVFGPTADLLGEILKSQTERGIGNLRRVWEYAERRMKLDPSSDTAPNGRVLSRILNEARFIDSPVAAEYFAGVLASSCSERGEDDSAVPFVELLRKMSSDEIRLHFVLYSTISRHFFGWPTNARRYQWNDCSIFVPKLDLAGAIPTEGQSDLDELEVALSGLIEHGLISTGARLVREDIRRTRLGQVNVAAGISFCPTDSGARLLLRALGLKGLTPSVLISMRIESSLSDELVSLLVDPSAISLSAKLPVKSATEDLVETIEGLESRIDELESLRETDSEDH